MAAGRAPGGPAGGAAAAADTAAATAVSSSAATAAARPSDSRASVATLLAGDARPVPSAASSYAYLPHAGSGVEPDQALERPAGMRGRSQKEQTGACGHERQ
jgi:hypothetical protein